MAELLILLSFALADPPAKPFAIQVVDDATGRGVPLVELETVNHLRYVTDSNGLVAFDEPGLLGKEVFFHVRSHGYEFPADGFGMRGRKLETKPGGEATLKIKRVNIAERLYRSTGEGIYADTLKLGREAPIKEPLLNAGVVGCDSVLNVEYKGRLYWFWGDTSRSGYPLGNFNSTGAWSALPGKGGLEPDRGIDFHYIGDGKGFVKGVAPMAGKGPTWIDSLAVLPDAKGVDRLCMGYMKVDGKMKPTARGTAAFDDAKEVFEPLGGIDLKARVFPQGHSLRDGKHLLFCHPFPIVRVPATVEAYMDVSQYESFTCVKTGSSLEKPEIERDASGTAVFQWRKNAPPVHPDTMAKWLASGLLKEGDARFLPVDADGKRIVLHRGSVAWNEYRKKWILVANQVGGKPSYLGEVWYAEADSPQGPWKTAAKIATHDRMDFYNPKLHPEFDRDGGRAVFFEGTYTKTFSGHPNPTPRYEYNQMMYRLDLADPRLRPAK